MNKRELAKKISDKVDGMTIAKVEAVLDLAFIEIADSVLAGDDFSVKNFGVFKKVQRSARKGRNPQTGEEVDIPPSETMKLSLSKVLKDRFKK